MNSVQLEFGWGVSPKGYRWALARATGEAEGDPRPALVAVGEPDAADGCRLNVPPAPYPGLFRAFAEVEPERAAILEFASRHGNVTEGPVDCLTDPVGPATGTFMTVWRAQISDMRRLVGLWDLLRRGDRGALAPHVRWREGKRGGFSVHFESHPEAEGAAGPTLGLDRHTWEIASADDRPAWMEGCEVGDPVLPAWVCLQQDVDEHLHHTSAETPAGMGWDAARGRPALRLVAFNLLSAVWLQFAEAVANDRTYGRCRECGRWFEVAPDAARTHRRYCSNACRSKAYRERQDRARRLFTAGKAIEEIAEELDADAAPVRRWITGDPGRTTERPE
jgi:hypothetical protein